MNKEFLDTICSHDIAPYGSDLLVRMESNLTKYFEREYRRHHSEALPEDYGVSSFDGPISTHEHNSETVSHYNDHIDIYMSFLDSQHHAYTMAYFGFEDGIAPDVLPSLSDAQSKKFDLIVSRLEIADGMNIVEFGCGFGGFARYILDRFPNCTITGFNPSETQATHLRETMLNDEAYKDRFSFVQDFIGSNNMKSNHRSSFDKAVSIGLLESIRNLDKFNELVSFYLKEGGEALHHSIVSMDTIPQLLDASQTMIKDYYPGGRIWPYREYMRHNKHMKPQNSWFINGMNYWTTLDMWHKNFWDNLDAIFPSRLSVEEVRKWNDYFVMCKAMFSPNNGKSYGNAHYLFKN